MPYDEIDQLIEDAIGADRIALDQRERWWNSLSDQERCWWAAKLAGADADVLYAIEKPWKYAELAYQEQQERR